MLLPSQHRELIEHYNQIQLGEVDDITDVIIEEVVEELVEECLEFGYDLDEAVEAVEEAATEYLMELNPYAPAGSKAARAYQKSTSSTKRAEARKAAVKGAVSKVKAKARGAVAAAGIAGSIAKDEARRAGRSASHAVSKASGAVRSAVSAKKDQVKKGVKGLLKRGLTAVASGAGRVAQTSRKVGSAASKAADRLGEEIDIFDYILEHLVSEGYADTNENALVIMANMSEEWRDSILEADSLAAMAARREARLARQRKKEGTPTGGGDFGHNYGKSQEQNRAEIEQRMKNFIKKKD